MRLIDAESLFDKVGTIKPINQQNYDDIGKFMNMITNEPTVCGIDIKQIRAEIMEYIYNVQNDLSKEIERGIDIGLQMALNTVDKYIEKKPKTGRCKDCKYFEYDSVAKVDGVPLIVAHEICNKWGDGCKTKEDGYCFLFEPQERSE